MSLKRALLLCSQNGEISFDEPLAAARCPLRRHISHANSYESSQSVMLLFGDMLAEATGV